MKTFREALIEVLKEDPVAIPFFMLVIDLPLLIIGIFLSSEPMNQYSDISILLWIAIGILVFCVAWFVLLIIFIKKFREWAGR